MKTRCSSSIPLCAFALLIAASAAAATPHAAKAVVSDTKSDHKDRASSKYETYQDLIEKAQNLTLQHDRLQASQLLTRGIRRESKSSTAYRELVKALDSLSTLFYTEKAHGLFSSAESIAMTKPKEALETYNEALRFEDSNLSLLKGLARAELVLADCSKADATTTQAEGINPFSGEVKLLRMQVYNCEKNFEMLTSALESSALEQDAMQKFERGLELAVAMQNALQSDPPDFKHTKALLATWETKDPDYPELHLWKWRYLQAVSTAEDAADNSKSVPLPSSTSRVAALRYVQLCQALTPRKRKSFDLDVTLCRGTEEVDTFLKASGQTPIPSLNTSRSKGK